LFFLFCIMVICNFFLNAMLTSLMKKVIVPGDYHDQAASVKAMLEEEIAKGDFATFVGNIVNRKVQIKIKKTLHKVFPVKEIAVRSLALKNKDTKEEVIVEEQFEDYLGRRFTQETVLRLREKQEESL